LRRRATTPMATMATMATTTSGNSISRRRRRRRAARVRDARRAVWRALPFGDVGHLEPHDRALARRRLPLRARRPRAARLVRARTRESRASR
jgi:hypothetical protein